MKYAHKISYVIAALFILISCGKNKTDNTINNQNPNGYFGQFMSTDQSEITMENVSNPRDVLYVYNDNFYLHMTDLRGTYRGNWKMEGNQLILGDYGVASGINFNGSNCLNLSSNFDNGIFCPRK
ncbi:MAG: hypothetical protein KC493_03775 [Bacteriovoracaceae bacterium]|nr:hypothetical protein [Bacteriovoracaceae bacterium]